MNDFSLPAELTSNHSNHWADASSTVPMAYPSPGLVIPLGSQNGCEAAGIRTPCLTVAGKKRPLPPSSNQKGRLSLRTPDCLDQLHQAMGYPPCVKMK